MLIETSAPRIALIECIAKSLKNTLNDRQISLMEYLNELAFVIEVEDIGTDCIVLKNDKYIVLLPSTYNEDDLIEIIARIRLQHVRYYQCYSTDVRNILDTEVAIFTEKYKNMPQSKKYMVGSAY
ncbi:MAG TPA: hypothetical protein PLJ57_05315 [Tepidanaerobacteraceae bacterium]|nr:hypothetical protein [Tepidanaerobacteraceae bacterium]